MKKKKCYGKGKGYQTSRKPEGRCAGMRYTCVVCNQEKYLFYEDNNMWFMERAGA